MKHHKFTTEEREELLKNPNIIKVLNSNVEYTEEFKQKALYEHKELGKTANQIFKEAGIPDWLNIAGYAKTCIRRWKYQQKHPNNEKRGRPKIEPNKPLCEMSQQELIREIRTIAMILEHKYGIKMNLKKIARIKREYGLITKIRKKNPYNIAFKKGLEHRTAPNLLKQNFLRQVIFMFYSFSCNYYCNTFCNSLMHFNVLFIFNNK